MKNILLAGAKNGNLPILDLIAINDLKTWLNEKDEKGNTPLHYAANFALAHQDEPSGHKVMDWITELCQMKDIPASLLLTENEERNTPLHDLIKINHKKFHTAYIKKCDKDFQDRSYLYHKNKAGVTPWDNKDFTAVETLLQFDKKKFTYEDDSPLHALCDNAAKYVKRKQVKPFMFLRRNKKGETPFTCAAKSADTKLSNLKALLKVRNVYQLAKPANCYDWLHNVIRYSNHPLAVLKKLNKYHLVISSIDCKDSYGNTPLHSAVLYESAPMMTYLIDRGANLTTMNKQNYSPLTYAAVFNKKNNFKYLFNLNEPHKNDQQGEDEWKRWLAIRRLYIVFGGQKLVDKLGQLPEFFDGGSAPKFISYLKQSLQDFTQSMSKAEKENYKNITQVFDHFHSSQEIKNDISKFANQIIMGEPLILNVESLTHVIGVIFEKQNDEIVMSYVDRGVWGNDADEEGKLTHAIISLRFPADKDKLTEIMQELTKTNVLKNAQAKEILFTQIPKMADAQFKNESSYGIDLISRYFKIGICFWANFKSIAHNAFINEFGIREGQSKYKQYNLSLLRNTLSSYQKDVAEDAQNKDLIAACESIIKEKETKYQNDQFVQLKSTPRFYKLKNAVVTPQKVPQNGVPSVMKTGGLFSIIGEPNVALVPPEAAISAIAADVHPTLDNHNQLNGMRLTK